MPNLKDYAEYNGMDDKKPGEILITALAGGEIECELWGGAASEIQDLKKDLVDFGINIEINPNDSQLIIMKNLDSAVQKLNQVKRSEENEAAIDITRDHLESILKWVRG